MKYQAIMKPGDYALVGPNGAQISLTQSQVHDLAIAVGQASVDTHEESPGESDDYWQIRCSLRSLLISQEITGCKACQFVGEVCLPHERRLEAIERDRGLVAS